MSITDQNVKTISKIEELPEYPLLKQLYTFRDEAHVLDFIDHHLFLLPLLLEAPVEIKKYFPDTPLILQVGIDPDYNEEIDLMLLIATPLDNYAARAKMNQLGEDWWLDAMERTDASLTIGLEFQ